MSLATTLPQCRESKEKRKKKQTKNQTTKPTKRQQ